MAKYYRNKNHKQVVTRTDDGPWTGEETVIVLPEADWRRVAELATAMGRDDSCCCPCDRPCGSCQEYKDVVALIAKVEADNG